MFLEKNVLKVFSKISGKIKDTRGKPNKVFPIDFLNVKIGVAVEK